MCLREWPLSSAFEVGAEREMKPGREPKGPISSVGTRTQLIPEGETLL